MPEDAVCAVCKKPFQPGEGRYRIAEGDVHAQCRPKATDKGKDKKSRAP